MKRTKYYRNSALILIYALVFILYLACLNSFPFIFPEFVRVSVLAIEETYSLWVMIIAGLVVIGFPVSVWAFFHCIRVSLYFLALKGTCLMDPHKENISLHRVLGIGPLGLYLIADNDDGVANRRFIWFPWTFIPEADL